MGDLAGGCAVGRGLFAAGACGLPGVGGGETRMAGGPAAGVFGCLGCGGEARVAGPGAVRSGECKGGGRGVGLGLHAVCWCSCLLAPVSMCGLMYAWRFGGGSCCVPRAATSISQMRVRI